MSSSFLRPGRQLILAGGILATLGCDVAPGESADDPNITAEAPVMTMTDSLGQPMGPITTNIVNLNKYRVASANLLARIEVQENEILEFYEPVPGVIHLSAAGAPSGRPILTGEVLKDLTAEEAWALATGALSSRGLKNGGKMKMPRALEEAIGRSLELPAVPTTEPGAQGGFSTGGGSQHGPEAVSSTGRPDSVQALRKDATERDWLAVPQPAAPATNAQVGFCDKGYFDEGFGGCYEWDWKVCKTNWSNGLFMDSGSNRTILNYNNVCPNTGSVVLWNRWVGDIGGNPQGPETAWLVPMHTVRAEGRAASRNCWYCGPPHYFLFRTEVRQAQGVRFHFRGYARWY